MNNVSSLISVIMPAYNAESIIADSIDSVLSQTYENIELIVVDDGSSDKTLDIIEKLKLKDARIKSFPNEKNIGVSKTRNKAIKLAKGQWIAFLDSDDVWKKNKLMKQLWKAEEVNGDFIFTGAEYMNFESEMYPGIFEVPDVVTFKKLLSQNYISTSSVLIKKELIGELIFEKDHLHEDYLLWLRILQNGNIAYGINEVLLTYRLHKNSKSGNKFKSYNMTYGVHRELGRSILQSIVGTNSHLFKSLLKYRKIIYGNK